MKSCILIYLILICSAKALVINIKEIKSNKGMIALVVFKSKDGFPKDSTKAVFKGFIQTNKFPYTVELIPGEYAASIFHDQNNNQRLDTNFFGIPREAFGFSNDVIGMMGPPSFKDAKFIIKNNKTAITIKLKTFL